MAYFRTFWLWTFVLQNAQGNSCSHIHVSQLFMLIRLDYTCSPTTAEPWLTEASGNQGESRDVTSVKYELYDFYQKSNLLKDWHEYINLFKIFITFLRNYISFSLMNFFKWVTNSRLQKQIKRKILCLNMGESLSSVPTEKFGVFNFFWIH